jgi:hypothetical protein
MRVRADLPPSVLWRNRQTEAHLILRSKPRNRRDDFETQITKPELPVLRPKPKNPPPPWFWGSTKKPTAGFEAKPGKTVATSFEAKPRNRRDDFEAQITKPELPVLRPKPENPPPPWFWGSTKKPTAGFEAKPGKTVATSFEAKLMKTVATGFEVKPAKIVRVVLRPRHSQTVDIGFEA